MSVFSEIFKREKPRVFLGVLAVAPRSDVKRHLDQLGMFKNEDLDTNLRHNLQDIFSLPSAQNIEDPKSTDLVLDVVVPNFQSGDAFELYLGDIGLPIMWRPKITISSRLYFFSDDKTKATFSVTQKMKFSQYIGRLLSWRSFFRFKPIFDSHDMEYLLYQACHKLSIKVQKAI